MYDSGNHRNGHERDLPLPPLHAGSVALLARDSSARAVEAVESVACSMSDDAALPAHQNQTCSIPNR